MTFHNPGILLFLALIWGTNTVYSQDSLSLDLESAITLALMENTDINIARLQVNTSEYALKEAFGNFLPKLSLSGNYYRNINKQVIFLPDIFGMAGPTKLGSDNDYRASLNLSVPVYSHFNNSNRELAETSLMYQKEAARYTRQNVMNATRKSYFNYLIAQEIVKVREAQLKNAEDILTDIEKRRRQGTLTDYDFTAAKVQVGQSKSSLLEAQNNILPLANNLKLFLGLRSDIVLELTEPIARLGEEFIIAEEASKMLVQNSRLKQLELEVNLNEKQEKLARSALYPTVDVIGNYNLQAQEDGFNLPEYQWANSSLIGLQVQFSIFNGHITKNKIQQAKIGKIIAEEQKDYTATANQMQLEELLSQLDFAMQKTAVQLESMNLTEEALALAKKRYRYGVGTFLEVSDAELSYTQARLIWLQAISEYKMAYYDYQLLTGQD